MPNDGKIYNDELPGLGCFVFASLEQDSGSVSGHLPALAVGYSELLFEPITRKTNSFL